MGGTVWLVERFTDHAAPRLCRAIRQLQSEVTTLLECEAKRQGISIE
jgi:hypothetical protein